VNAIESTEPAAGIERRRHRRTSVLLRGSFRCGSEVMDCLITNLSAGGARLRPVQPIQGTMVGTLETSRLGLIPGEIVWHGGDSVGVRFLDQPAHVGAMIRKAMPNSRIAVEATA
jgi:hypothetical protein